MKEGHLSRNMKDKKAFKGQRRDGRALQNKEQHQQSHGKVGMPRCLGNAACVERGGEHMGPNGAGLECHS